MNSNNRRWKPLFCFAEEKLIYYFLLRGYNNVIGEFNLFALAYDIQKIVCHLGFHKVMTPEKEEALSKIIAEINSRTGKIYDKDVAVKSMLQICDIMMKSE